MLPSFLSRYGMRAILAVLAVGGAFIVIFVVRLASTQSLSKLYHPDPVPRIEHPRFSSDESKLAFSICGPCRVAICSLVEQKTVLLSPTKGSSIFDAAFDPRSDRVAYILRKELPNGDRDYQIATSRTDGSGLRILTSSDTEKRFPRYSFDGTKIIFQGRERCLRDRKQYCLADAYELDLSTRQEKRLTDLQALSIGPVSFLPGNERIALTAFGTVYSRERGYAARIDIEQVYKNQQRVFVLDVGKPSQLLPIATGTPTAHSPWALPSGEIAFLSRVNEYDGVKGAYVYDVFIHGSAGSRRLTNISRYVRAYAIANSAKSVAFVVETSDKPAKAQLMLWSARSGQARNVQCDKLVEERTLVP